MTGGRAVENERVCLFSAQIPLLCLNDARERSRVAAFSVYSMNVGVAHSHEPLPITLMLSVSEFPLHLVEQYGVIMDTSLSPRMI